MAYRNRKYMVVALTLLVHQAGAQETLKVMLEQLAALKGYAGTVANGYRIAEKGIHLVRDIKSGEFGLHQVFFESLGTVDDAVRRWPELAEAEQLIGEINGMFNRAVVSYGSSRWLRGDELQHLKMLQHSLSVQGRRDRESLMALTRDGQLSMTDGERIGRINEIDREVRERYEEVKAFLAQVGWIIFQRQKEKNYINTLKKWYEIQ